MANKKGKRARVIAERKPRRLRRLGVAAFVVVALASSFFVHFRCALIADADSLYHMGHAAVYRERGPLYHDFPWTTYSVLRAEAADNWYGFHLLLIPFTFLPGPSAQIRTAGALLMAAMLVLLGFALRRLRVSHPWAWPFLLVYVSPMALWRMLMMRPSVLTSGLGPLLAVLLMNGAPWQVALVAAGANWVHLTFFWVTPIILLVMGASAYLLRRPLRWVNVGAALAGWAVGWAARPNPLGAAKLLYVQVFELSRVKQSGVPLTFGTELLPMDPKWFVLNFAPLLAVWLADGAVLLWLTFLRREQLAAETKSALWGTFALSAVFFEMMFLMSRRAVDLWLAFTVPFIAVAWTAFGEPWRRSRALYRLPIGGLGLTLLLGLATYSLYWNGRTMDYFGVPTSRLRSASEWLRANASPGEIVCNLHWDVFPHLFYWNREQRYIGGMDPIFQYAYRQDLYWKIHHLGEFDANGATCGQPTCDPAHLEDAYTVLRRDFHAAYLLLIRISNSELITELRSDPRFRLAHEDADSVIYALSPSAKKQAPPG